MANTTTKIAPATPARLSRTNAVWPRATRALNHFGSCRGSGGVAAALYGSHSGTGAAHRQSRVPALPRIQRMSSGHLACLPGSGVVPAVCEMAVRRVGGRGWPAPSLTRVRPTASGMRMNTRIWVRKTGVGHSTA